MIELPGVALLINKSYLFSEVHLNTPLQAVAARVTLNKVITFCSIYLPPSDHVAKTDLINLIEQLPSLFVLLGDFNSHSPVWGNESYNSRGQMLEHLFSEMDLCILNDGSSTYIHPATGSTSTLDLSICGPSLVLDYEWNIHEDLCGSDHFPIILTSNTVKEEAAPNRWNFKKAVLPRSVFLRTDGGGGHVCRGSRRSVYWPTYSSIRQSYTKNTLLKKTSQGSMV